MEGSRKVTRNLSQDTRCTGEIRSQHILNRSLDHYFYTHLFTSLMTVPEGGGRRGSEKAKSYITAWELRQKKYLNKKIHRVLNQYGPCMRPPMSSSSQQCLRWLTDKEKKGDRRRMRDSALVHRQVPTARIFCGGIVTARKCIAGTTWRGRNIWLGGTVPPS